jgi:DNA-binding XRE family transcriptional regulator
MLLDLTDEEAAALLIVLTRVIEGDRYPMSRRMNTLRSNPRETAGIPARATSEGAISDAQGERLEASAAGETPHPMMSHTPKRSAGRGTLYGVKSMATPNRGRSTAAAIDDHVGGRIRERRIMLGLTQQQLAEMIGVSYQQAHKYERGINRVSAGRLFEIARVLNASITYFYEGIGEEGPREITLHQRMR